MKKIFKIIDSIFLGFFIISLWIYFFVLQYPNLNKNPKINKWYRVTSEEMKSSDGSQYRAFFKKGNKNKVLIYFAGEGVSINQETANQDMYNKNVIGIDMLANITMNMGGIASKTDQNPLKDWSVIIFPYATADFHTGTNKFRYIDSNGKEKILYHYGYNNYKAVMEKIMMYTNINNPDTVVVSGYSAWWGGAALLADDIFTSYFPNAKSKTVLVDGMLLLNSNWKSIASDIWNTPKEISDRLISNNLILDTLTALYDKFGSGVNILFDSSTRYGDLAKVQNFFDTWILEVDEHKADVYQQILKNSITTLKENAWAYLFIWDWLPRYDDPRNLTMHTIIATPYYLSNLGNQNISIATWLMNALDWKLDDYGLDLVDKEY